MSDDLKIADSWNHEDVLKTALQERKQLLKSKPELRILQDEIDKRLSGEESFEDRMKILGTMIGSNLEKLFTECNTLAEVCDNLGIDAKIPILELKKKSRELSFPSIDDQTEK